MIYKLGDICDIFDGPHATPPETDFGPIFLGIKNISEQCELDFTDVKYLSEADYQKWTKRVTPQENDIVFSYEATLNRYALIPKGFYGCLGRRLAIARVKDANIVNAHYLYHYFCSPGWNAFILANKVVGSTVLRVSVEEFPDYEVDLPDIKIQNSVARILDDIAEKRDNNNAICANLEAMAKLLYDYWFVQFDFPDENGKPYKSSGGKMVWNNELKREIPAGWEVETLADCTSMYQPKTFDAKLLEQDGKYRVYGAGGYMGQYHEYNHEESEIIISCRGSCGNIYKSMPKSLITGNAMIVHPANTFIREYLYWSLIRYGVHNCITGSVQPQITRDELSKWKVIIPSNSVIESFNRFAVELDMKISAIVEENQQLASLRDFLLPMLMNGQVNVGKAGA